jgi:hypothetical protein
MRGIGQRAAAIGAVTALLAGVGVGAANAATSHHQSTSSAAAKTKSAAKAESHAGASSSTAAKAARDETESRTMKVREQRGPGSPREERNESQALQRKELRRGP